MNTHRMPFRLRQRGFVTAAAVIILIVFVMFILNQTYGIIGTTSNANQAQGDSVAAFFLAESGVEHAKKVFVAANPITNTTCTTMGSFSMPRGTVSLTGTSTPQTCNNNSSPQCTNCLLRSTGTVGSTTRIIETSIGLTTVNGATCNKNTAVPDCSNLTANPPTVPPTWSLTVKNPSANTAIALLHLAATRQGNPSGAGCTAASNCALQWSINSQNGARSVLSMGNLYTIAGLGTLTPVYQTVSSSQPEDAAEVGVLFPGTSTPAVVGAYWDDTNSGSGGTHGKFTDAAGNTNNGASISASPACADPATAQTQSCTNWCFGDTLVYGFSGGSTSGLTDTLGSVLFNTSGTPAQNVSLSNVSHFPNSSIPGAPTTLYSEIWYAQNPNLSAKAAVSPPFVVGERYLIKTLGSTTFTSIGASGTAPGTVDMSFVATGVGTGTGTAMPLNPFALNASSYKGNGTAAIGASWTSDAITTNAVSLTAVALGAGHSANGTTLTVASAPPSPIYPGALVTKTGTPLTGTPYITRQLSGTEGGAGDYELSESQASVSGGNWTVTNAVLSVGKFANYPAQIITPQILTAPGSLPQIISTGAGDSVSSLGGAAPNITNATVAAQLTSIETGGMTTGLGGRGTYSLIATTASNVANNSARTWRTKSSILNVSACILCFIESTDPVITSYVANKTIASQLTQPALLAGHAGRTAEATGGVGRYVVASSGNPALPMTVASAATFRAGTPGATIYLPATESKPTVNNTRIAKAGGTGVLAADTRTTAAVVANTATNSFTVSPSPSAALDTATICAGACAFFNHASAITDFSIGKPANTDYWASGFICISGADLAPVAVTSSSVQTTTWHEVIQ